jgi:hypothetical protein
MNPRYRHVNLSALKRVCLERLDSEPASPEESKSRFVREYPRELANVRRQARVRPVRVNGSRAVGLKMGWFETVLRDGTLGYFQRRTDDCVQASIATLIQLSPERVPDAHLDRQLIDGLTPEEVKRAFRQQLSEWSDSRGLNIVIHTDPPTAAQRWIGMLAGPDQFNDHCLVMTGTECLWDTTHIVPPSSADPVANRTDFTVQDIYYGITVEKG